MKKQKGITLIALIITIIVLLILAGVAISMIAGNEGILARAEVAVNKANLAGAKEQAELMIAEFAADYYEMKFANREKGTHNMKITDYMTDKIGNGKTSSNGEFRVTIEGKTVTVEGHNGYTKVIGTLSDTGKIAWNSESNGGVGEEEQPVDDGKYSVTYNANGGTGSVAATARYEVGSEVAVDFANVPTNSGRTFLGWSKNKSAEEPEFVSDGTTSFEIGEENVVLYAVWSSIVGNEVSYAPSGTYNWKAKYASSYLEDIESNDITLSSATGEDFEITKWRVLSENRETGEIKMVPAALAEGKVKIYGAQGYNNAVKLLNDACSSLYGNLSKGIKARSINYEDFIAEIPQETMEKLKSNLVTGRGEWLDENLQAKAVYASNWSQYPTIYEQEDLSVITYAGATKETIVEKGKGLSGSEQTVLIERTGTGVVSESVAEKGKIATATSIRPYHTYWVEYYATIYGMLGAKAGILLPSGKDTNYWVASRCVEANSTMCNFYMRKVYGGGFDACWMFNSGGGHNGMSEYLFPVLTLNSNLLNWNDGSGWGV